MRFRLEALIDDTPSGPSTIPVGSKGQPFARSPFSVKRCRGDATMLQTCAANDPDRSRAIPVKRHEAETKENLQTVRRSVTNRRGPWPRNHLFSLVKKW